MSDEYITPTAVGTERNCSRSKVALQPDKTFRIAGSGGKTASLFAMSRVIAINKSTNLASLKTAGVLRCLLPKQNMPK